MLFLFFLYLLFDVGQAQVFIYPQEGNATIAYRDMNIQKCVTIKVDPGIDYVHYLETSEIVERACKEVSTRQKRDYWGILGLLAVYPTIVERQWDHAEDQMMLERKNELLEILNMENIDVDFEKFKFLLKWPGTKIAQLFNYTEDQIGDAWVALQNKSLWCNSKNRLELEMCGKANADRKLGTHAGIAVSLGSFSNDGTIYKNRDLPGNIVAVDGVLQPATCRFLKTYYECEMKRNSTCSLENLSECKILTHRTPDKVYIKDFSHDFKVVATTAPIYTTVKNGTTASHRLHSFQHVGLSLPGNSFAEFNGIKIPGSARHKFEHFIIHNEQENFDEVDGDFETIAALLGPPQKVDEYGEVIKPKFSWMVYYVTMTLFLLLLIVCVLYILYSRRRRHIFYLDSEA